MFIRPKALVEQMSAASMVPPGWDTATFGSLRDIDDFRNGAVAVVVSRQLPPPSVVKLMAEVVFGREVQRMAAGDWYPTMSASHLMADGTRRQAEVSYHPDPDVELVCWTICEAEVLQAVGRVRGIRRDARSPVLVFVLNQIDLGHIPVSTLLTWDEVNALCGPVMLMAARGCIPKTSRDIARTLGWWNDRPDPAANAQAWVRDNPHHKVALDDLFRTGKITNPFTHGETTFRRESAWSGRQEPSLRLADRWLVAERCSPIARLTG